MSSIAPHGESYSHYPTQRPLESARPLCRISMSLPEDALTALDRFVAKRGFPSRSHAIGLMLNQYIMEYNSGVDDEVKVGTITLFYNRVSDLQARLVEIRCGHGAEIISSLNVQLVRNQTLEVFLVQGPGDTLRAIAEDMKRVRGVIYGRLQMVESSIPPPLGKAREAQGEREITAIAPWLAHRGERPEAHSNLSTVR
jgi:CopG family nickel-responsive transcriptional regulator